MTTIPKNTRALQIVETIEIVAKYFSVDPEKVVTAFAPKNQAVARARILVWYHLHKCGMSFESIGRIHRKNRAEQALSADNVSRRVRYGVLSLSEEDQLILATLPRIQTSLQISTT